MPIPTRTRSSHGWYRRNPLGWYQSAQPQDEYANLWLYDFDGNLIWTLDTAEMSPAINFKNAMYAVLLRETDGWFVGVTLVTDLPTPPGVPAYKVVAKRFSLTTGNILATWTSDSFQYTGNANDHYGYPMIAKDDSCVWIAVRQVTTVPGPFYFTRTWRINDSGEEIATFDGNQYSYYGACAPSISCADNYVFIVSGVCVHKVDSSGSEVDQKTFSSYVYNVLAGGSNLIVHEFATFHRYDLSFVKQNSFYYRPVGKYQIAYDGTYLLCRAKDSYYAGLYDESFTDLWSGLNLTFYASTFACFGGLFYPQSSTYYVTNPRIYDVNGNLQFEIEDNRYPGEIKMNANRILMRTNRQLINQS